MSKIRMARRALQLALGGAGSGKRALAMSGDGLIPAGGSKAAAKAMQRREKASYGMAVDMRNRAQSSVGPGRDAARAAEAGASAASARAANAATYLGKRAKRTGNAGPVSAVKRKKRTSDQS